jgi:hypothetical protein
VRLDRGTLRQLRRRGRSKLELEIVPFARDGRSAGARRVVLRLRRG